MADTARFGHVNLIARDWRKLADFYIERFGCHIVPPERDYSGPDLEAATGVPRAALRGAHLRLPGYGQVAANFVLMSVFYWSVHRPELMAPAPVLVMASPGRLAARRPITPRSSPSFTTSLR